MLLFLLLLSSAPSADALVAPAAVTFYATPIAPSAVPFGALAAPVTAAASSLHIYVALPPSPVSSAPHVAVLVAPSTVVIVTPVVPIASAPNAPSASSRNPLFFCHTYCFPFCCSSSLLLLLPASLPSFAAPVTARPGTTPPSATLPSGHAVALFVGCSGV